MMLNLIAIILVLLIAYMWLTRGFFSALIHFLCTLIAGAVAFALWEPLGYAILENTDSVGFIDGSAWGLALAVPFAVTLIVARFIADRTLRSNVIVSQAANYAGGGLLGLGSAVIAVGIATISLSYLRVDFLDAKSFAYSSNGSIVRRGGLWVPFDSMTARLYGHLSERALRVDTPLARWHPALHEAGNAMRMSFAERGRNTYRPSDFDVRARFTVKDGSFSSLLTDRWNPGTQSVVDPSGKAYPEDTRLEGFVVVFKAGSREKDGKTAVGAAQLMLVSENQDEERVISFPVAVTTQAEPSNPGAARFRYEAQEVFIASSGAASEAIMAFEFPVMNGFEPVALYVKGVRVDVESIRGGPAPTFASASERDSGLASLGVGNPAALPSAGTGDQDTRVSTESRPGQVAQVPGFSITNAIPIFALQEGQHQTVELGKNSEWFVIRGQLKATVEEARRWPNVTERNLRINNFIAVNDRVMVQVEVTSLPGGVPNRMSLLGKSFDAAEALLPPLLVDTAGESYQPVGFVYIDEQMYELSFDPSRPIRAMSELPTLSRSRPAQRLVLIFQVSLGREIKSFNKGSKIIAEFVPPVPCNQRQTNR
jgi:hypothetical protein